MNLLNVTPADAVQALDHWVTAHGEPAYRAHQIVRRLWVRPVARWEDASDLPSTLRSSLSKEYPLPRPRLTRRQLSSDGTEKFLWEFADGARVESVLIPEGRRRTLCVSSQSGCAYGCRFCATGRMGFERHLSPWEILAQPRELLLRPDGARPSNIVFMGMGEPLHNWSAVDTALTVLNDPGGFGIGARRITVSTVGIVPKLLELARRPEQFRVALSLHAPTSEKRAMLMPVERKYPLDDVLRALETFRKRVTFEYVMISEVNDSADDAGRLAELARPLGALINLLPLHPGGAPDLQPTPLARMMWFADLLRDLGAQATVRRSRGLDISAACGQLRVETEHLRGIASEEHAHVQQ